MGTLGVYRKEVLPWLVRWAHRAGKRDVCPALAACSSQPSTKYYFSRCTFFHFISIHPPATWAGSRVGSQVSVSLVLTIAYCFTGYLCITRRKDFAWKSTYI